MRELPSAQEAKCHPQVMLLGPCPDKAGLSKTSPLQSPEDGTIHLTGAPRGQDQQPRFWGWALIMPSLSRPAVCRPELQAVPLDTDDTSWESEGTADTEQSLWLSVPWFWEQSFTVFAASIKYALKPKIVEVL